MSFLLGHNIILTVIIISHVQALVCMWFMVCNMVNNLEFMFDKSLFEVVNQNYFHDI